MDIKDFEPLFGNWTIDSFIGSGSFGKVYKIKREDYGAIYFSALKWISIPQDDAELKQLRYNGMDEASITGYYHALIGKLTNEMQIMSRLRGHSNIVSYEDHQIVPKKNSIGYDVFIRMELLTSLNEYILEKTCTQADVIQLGIDMCNALEICQRYNIIHRDIKPDNIFLSETGSFKLGDFGIARQLEHTATELSKKGTYLYMAPEVYKAQQYDSTVDLYSLGIVMYRLLNGGRVPFLPLAPNPIMPSDNEKSLVRRMSGEAMPIPLNAGARLSEIVLKACSYDPKDRHSSPKQMREELQAIQYSKEEAQFVVRGGDKLGTIESSREQKHVEKPPVETEATDSVFGRASDPQIAPRTGEPVPTPGLDNSEDTHSVFASAGFPTTEEKQEADSPEYVRAQEVDFNATDSVFSDEMNIPGDSVLKPIDSCETKESSNEEKSAKDERRRKRMIYGISGVAGFALLILGLMIQAENASGYVSASPTKAPSLATSYTNGQQASSDGQAPPELTIPSGTVGNYTEFPYMEVSNDFVMPYNVSETGLIYKTTNELIPFETMLGIPIIGSTLIQMIDYNTGAVIQEQTYVNGETVLFTDFPDGIYYFYTYCEGYIPNSTVPVHYVHTKTGYDGEGQSWSTDLVPEHYTVSSPFKVKLIDQTGKAISGQGLNFGVPAENGNIYSSGWATSDDAGYLTTWSMMGDVEYNDVLWFYILNDRAFVLFGDGFSTMIEAPRSGDEIEVIIEQ